MSASLSIVKTWKSAVTTLTLRTMALLPISIRSGTRLSPNPSLAALASRPPRVGHQLSQRVSQQPQPPCNLRTRPGHLANQSRLLEIKSGSYKSSAAGWVSGLSVTNAQDSSLVWATESNADVCSTVLAKGIDYVENTDLSGEYTDTATPVVNLQIAKQGYR